MQVLMPKATSRSPLASLLADARRQFEERLGIAGDDRLARVRRRLLQPQLDRMFREEADRITAAVCARVPVTIPPPKRRP